MIDLHCHILPGVDDGADTLETACQMARLAAQSGVSIIVATPHCNLPDCPENYRGETLLRKFDALDRLLQHYGIPVRILPGAEVFARHNLPQLLESGRLVTLNHSRYLLVEFFFGESPQTISSVLRMVTEYGLVPVIAHPERYEAVQRDPMLAVEWFRSGYVIQVNKGSLLGRLGRHAQKTAFWLLNEGLVHVVASDAHHTEYRTPFMGTLVQMLQERYPAPYLRLILEKNPRRIIENQIIPPPNEEF